MLRVLHFNNSPGVETTTDLLPLHLDQLVGANHSKGNTGLGKSKVGIWKEIWKIKISERRG